MRAKVRWGVTFGWAAFAAVGCGPPPEPVVAPVPTAVVAAPASATAVVEPPPKEILPALHPCVPEFIQRELAACPSGVGGVDYSAVANAMAAMTAAGPLGPRPKEKKPVPRELLPLEEKTATVARAFLCERPAKKGGGAVQGGTPSPETTELDDEYATTLFDLGRLYLNANHFEEALFFLYDVTILDPQKHAEVEYSARFLVESARPLGEARPECADIVTALIQAVHVHVCEGPGAEQRKETCDALGATTPQVP